MSDEIVNNVWKKGVIVPGLPPDIFRKDACGALIMRDKYGKDNPFGWEIDHIFPRALGGGDEISNLRPLHRLNNLNKSNDYPSYTAVVSFDGKENVTDEHNLTVNQKTREILKKLYPNAW